VPNGGALRFLSGCETVIRIIRQGSLIIIDGIVEILRLLGLKDTNLCWRLRLLKIYLFKRPYFEYIRTLWLEEANFGLSGGNFLVKLKSTYFLTLILGFVFYLLL
jgi:hypothetical protein